MSTSNPDTDQLMLWQRGGLSSASELGPWSPERAEEVDGKIASGLINRQMLSAIDCPDCHVRMTLVKRAVLVCEKCKNTIDTRKDFRPEFYSYSANLKDVVKRSVDALHSVGLTEAGVSPIVPDFASMRWVATLNDSEGRSVELLLATERVKQRGLHEAWGWARSNGHKAILIHPGLTKAAEQLLEFGVESSPIFALDFQRLWSEPGLRQAANFPRFRDRVSLALSAISNGLAGPSIEHDGEGLFDNSEAALEELARSGGERYQRPALKLLMTLGPTYPFSKAGWVPDGVLLDPAGFWIVDPKSSELGFSFSTAERDKIARYLGVLDAKQSALGRSLRFRGEILVTRTAPIDASRLRLAADFIRSRSQDFKVALVSHEGLVWLRDQAAAHPEYWHMRSPEDDSLNLLTLQPKGFIDGAVPPESAPFIDSPVKLIGPLALKAYWEFVRARRLFPGMGGRTPESIAELAQSMYVQEFVRPRDA